MSVLDWTSAIGETVISRDESPPSSGARAPRLRPEAQKKGALELLKDAMCAQLQLSGSAGVVLTPAALSHTFGQRSVSFADAEERRWEARNRRRLLLIDKELANDLSGPERVELEELGASMAAELNVIAPLPFDRLEELERRLNAARGR
jgi:hypothetical protein